MRNGELQSYQDGRARRIPIDVDPRLHGASARRQRQGVAAGSLPQPPRRREGRPSKTPRPGAGDAGPKLENIEWAEPRYF